MIVFVLIMWAAILSGCIFTLFRSNAVYNERIRVTHEIHRLGLQEINAGGNPDWRWAAYEAGPSYHQMLYKFWIPVGSFFENAECLKERMTP